MTMSLSRRAAKRRSCLPPLLSQAIALIREQREGDRLTSRGYAQAGGVGHAVQTAAGSPMPGRGGTRLRC